MERLHAAYSTALPHIAEHVPVIRVPWDAPPTERPAEWLAERIQKVLDTRELHRMITIAIDE